MRGRAVAFGILLVVLLLALVEGVARLFPHRDRAGPQAGFVEADRDLIWRLKPIASGPGKTNALGLRDPTYRADADVTILILGDSVSWGDGIDDVTQVYPQRLENLLQVRAGERIVEVINAGVPGYSTFQERRYLERDGLALRPDLVVLQFCLNDLVEPYLSTAEFGGDNYFMGVDTRDALQGAFGTAIRYSRAVEALVRALQNAGRRTEAFQVEKLTQVPLSPELEGAWNDILRELDRVLARSREHDIPVLLLIAPYRFQLSDPDRLRQPQDRLMAHAEKAALPYVDLLPHLARAQGTSTGPVFADASHLSADGHSLTAGLLADRISAMLPNL